MSRLIRENIWAIVAAIASLWGGYATGTATTNLTLERVKEQIEVLERSNVIHEQRLCRLEAIGATGECKR